MWTTYLLSPEDNVSSRVSRAAGINVDDGVAPGAPLCRIEGFELFIPRRLLQGNTAAERTHHVIRLSTF